VILHVKKQKAWPSEVKICNIKFLCCIVYPVDVDLVSLPGSNFISFRYTHYTAGYLGPTKPIPPPFEYIIVLVANIYVA